MFTFLKKYLTLYEVLEMKVSRRVSLNSFITIPTNKYEYERLNYEQKVTSSGDQRTIASFLY